MWANWFHLLLMSEAVSFSGTDMAQAGFWRNCLVSVLSQNNACSSLGLKVTGEALSLGSLFIQRLHKETCGVDSSIKRTWTLWSDGRNSLGSRGPISDHGCRTALGTAAETRGGLAVHLLLGKCPQSFSTSAKAFCTLPDCVLASWRKAGLLSSPS